MRVLSSFPTQAELQAILERQEPVLIRPRNLGSGGGGGEGDMPFDLGRSFFSPVRASLSICTDVFGICLHSRWTFWHWH